MSVDFLYGVIFATVVIVGAILLNIGLNKPVDQELHFEITKTDNPPNKVFPSGGESGNGGPMPNVANKSALQVLRESKNPSAPPNRPSPPPPPPRPEPPKNLSLCDCCGKIKGKK